MAYLKYNEVLQCLQVECNLHKPLYNLYSVQEIFGSTSIILTTSILSIHLLSNPHDTRTDLLCTDKANYA